MPAPDFADLKGRIDEICAEALASGDIAGVSYGTLQRALAETFDCTREDLRPLKDAIKNYATQRLTEPAAEQAAQSSASPLAKSKMPSTKASAPEPSKQSTKRKKAVIPSSDAEVDASEEDEVQPVKNKGKRKSSSSTHKAPGGYKSKEFLDSEDNPRSGPVEAPSDEDEQPAPRKKLKKAGNGSSENSVAAEKKGKSKQRKPAADEAPGEAEINRLKGFVKACGVRLLAKETESMSEKQTIKHLKAKLADLGMTGRMSMAKAAGIKEKRALEKEMADLAETQPKGPRNRLDEDGGRGNRRRAAAESSAKVNAAPKRPIIVGDSDSEEEDKRPENESSASEESEEEPESDQERFRQEQRKLDKQQEKRTKQFAKLVNKSIF